MFWRKKKKNDPVEKHVENISIQIIQPCNRLNSLNLRRNVLDWRDKHTANIEMHLRREVPTLMNLIDVELDKLDILESTFKIRKVTDLTILPLIKSWASTESNCLLDEARSELLAIYEFSLGPIKHEENIEIENSKDHIFDAITASSIGILGISVIPLITSASVISAGGLAGLFGATVLSLPILGAGVLFVSLSLAFSGHRMIGLKERALKRYRSHLYKSIKGSIVGSAEWKYPSLCHQLQNLISTSSDDIISEIKE